ncbi:acyl carrier protein [Hymenobacter sp. HD11105]
MQLPIQQQVYSYLSSKPTSTTKPSDDSRFREDLGMDQIDFFELVIRLENLYHVRIPDTELEQIKTVQQLINCLNDQVVGQRWNCATLMA